MRFKPRHKRRIMWSVISVIGAIFFAIIIVPPMIHINSLKTKIENIIFKETGIPAQIHGNINFSLLGKTTIVAHDIALPNGVVSSCEFSVPLRSIFDMKNADISTNMIISGADLLIEKIVPFDMNTNIVLRNSNIKFLNKNYHIVWADLSKEKSHINMRTDQHSYKITTVGNKFEVKNKNNELSISGTLAQDGSANAHMDITAQNINQWFEFEKPKINGRFPITSDVKWNGKYGFEFSDISANGVNGSIILQDDGYKIIKLKSNKMNYDLSFILEDSYLLKNVSLDLDFYGNIKFANEQFKHLYVNAVGTQNEIQIKEIVADDLKIKNGTINKDGAHNLYVSLPRNGVKTTCTFSGTPNDWSCSEFSYNNEIFGNLSVNRNEFFADIKSNKTVADINTIIKSSKQFGNVGTIKFDFPDMAGVIKITKRNTSVEYNFAKNKTLTWAKTDLPFLPEFMLKETGDFVWDNGTMLFVPKSKTWNLSTNKDYFYISGINFKQWFPNIDLKPVNDLPYIISGNYKNNTISNLTIEIANHKFIGSASGNSITLKTNLLNADSFLSQKYIDNIEQNSFFYPAPITIPFDINTNIALSANSLIYRGQKYNNFVYSLHPDIQTFSITDSDRGNILATMTRNHTNYDINIQLNKFVWDEKLLPQNMPLNISNSSITAEIKLKTSGKIARDVYDNLHGTFDASFNGGTLYGLGFEEFYASAPKINLLNAEYALARALSGGTTPLKQMRIIGTYNMGDIKTTRPLVLSLRHIDAVGDFKIQDSKMVTSLKLILRGTSPNPSPIELSVYDDGYRDYYLYEIMNNFDADYMRNFVQSHEKF